jgi:hypothetical protein
MTDIRRTPAPLQWRNPDEGFRKLGSLINNLLDGKHNATSTVTLTANSATTALADERIGVYTVIQFTPQSTNAATAIGNLYQTFPNTTAKQAVLNHANNAQEGRTFGYSLHG